MARFRLSRRGQPVIALGLVVMSWSAVRIVSWHGDEPALHRAYLRPPPAAARAAPPEKPAAVFRKTDPAMAPAPAPGRSKRFGSRHEARRQGHGGLQPANAHRFAQSLRQVPGGYMPEPQPIASGLPGQGEADAPLAGPRRERAGGAPRWSGDGWLLARPGGAGAAQARGAVSYGGSQAGAVVRYRLGEGGAGSAYGYLRASLAIGAPGKDREMAIGFGGRPLPALPLRVLAEARFQDAARTSLRVRPVAVVVTELPPQALPLGIRAEAYAQAGYAGGSAATAFYDAQIVMDRTIGGSPARARGGLRLGGGIWSGGQRGAVRLDAGPRASFELDLGGKVASRVSLDWRMRVAGNARPGSGAALVIASSF